jgi:hypothetical protein
MKTRLAIFLVTVALCVTVNIGRTQAAHRIEWDEPALPAAEQGHSPFRVTSSFIKNSFRCELKELGLPCGPVGTVAVDVTDLN